MKKRFSLLLFRIGGFVALLGITALVLMMVIKLLITMLVLIGIGGLIFKILFKNRQQLSVNHRFLLPIAPEKAYVGNKIKPIYNTANKNKTIVPII